MKRYPLRLAGLFFGVMLAVGFVRDCHGQSLDSLKRVILSVQAEQKVIQYNLLQAHNEHGIGTLFIAAGAVATIGGSILYARQDENKDLDLNTKNTYLIIAGTAMLTAGVILHIDSHKFIGRAGIFKLKKR